MSDNTPTGSFKNPSDKPEGIDLSKTIDDLSEKANVTINVAAEKVQDPNVQRTLKSAALLGVSLSLTYLAAKKGTKAGMKPYIHTGQSLVDSAGHYADIAKKNAEVSYRAVEELRLSIDQIAKAIKKK